MEERVVPAFDLTINGDAVTANVSSSFTAGTTTFNATGTGAILDVDDIEGALALGNVIITTGASGAEAGNISWFNDNYSVDNLDYFGSLRSLSILTSVSHFKRSG
jgi:hypothetical protein